MRSALLIALLPVAAFAQTIYSWEDADGVHYTDDLATVPKDARNVEAQEAETRPNVAVAPKPAEAKPEVQKQEVTSDDARLLAERDRSEGAWRQRFIEAHQRVDSVESHIKAAKAALPPEEDCYFQPVLRDRHHRPATGVAPAPRPETVRYGAARPCRVSRERERQLAEIAQMEADLVDAKAQLDQLDRDASRAAVPREWRRGY